MANTSFKNRIMSFSPHIEMIVRRLYWYNIKLFRRFTKPKKSLRPLKQLNYSHIKNFLLSTGVKSGSLLVVHSAYGSLKGRGKDYNQILDFLIEIIGKEGTLAMPATPKFSNNLNVEDYLDEDLTSEVVFEYDVQNSKITTGVLPAMLYKRTGAVRSSFPINTLVSLGPLSSQLYCDEFSFNSPLACGIGSSWKKLTDNKALIIGLGTDLTHSLTSIHVSEDSYESDWAPRDWYHEKNFKITNGDTVIEKVIRERRPKWGALHYGERTLCKDLSNEGILISANFDGVLVEVIDAYRLNIFLRAKQKSKPGYPYFWL